MKVKSDGVNPLIKGDGDVSTPDAGQVGAKVPVGHAPELGLGRKAFGTRGQNIGANTKADGASGAGKASLFAHMVRGGAPSAADIVGKLPAVGVKTVDALLAKLPMQAEIRRIEIAQAQPNRIAFRPFEDLKADLPAPFVRALDRLPKLTARFNPVELYTADDIADKKEAFIEAYKAGERFNPEFTYDKGAKSLRASLAQDGTTPEKVKAELLELRAGVAGQQVGGDQGLEATMQTVLLRKLDDDLSTLTLLEGLERRDDKTIKAALETKYGRGIDDALYDAAKMVYGFLSETQAHAPKRKPKKGLDVAEAAPPPKMDLPPDLAAHLSKNETMTAGEFKDAVDWMLGRYYAMYEEKSGRPFPPELKYKVELDNKYSAIDVRDKSSDGPVIGIPDKPRSPKKYLELLRHEIDMHARQSLNGHFMFGFGGGALKMDEETWYEGLAKKADTDLMMEMFGDNTNPTMPYYPFAIRMAEEGKSFLEVFEAMLTLRLEAGSGEKTALSNAWNTAYRVFRGHIDTANPDAYAMPKDQAYLRGWMLQNQLASKGLSHLNEAAIGPIDGPELLSRFDFGPDDLMFPDVDLTRAYFEQVMRPKAEVEMAEAAKAPPAED